MFNRTNDASFVSNSFKKMMHYTGNPKSSHCGGWKNESFVFHLKSHFQLIFDLKHLENTLNTLLNQFMAVKKPTNRPKTRNPLEIIFFSELRYIVLGVLKVKKKTSKHNPPYHMKHLNIKINRFGG